MRYLHIISSMDPRGGGPAEGVHQLCRVATRLSHRVEVATLDAPGAQCVGGADYAVHQLGPTQLGNYRYTPRLVPWLRDNADRFDAVIVNGLWQYQGLATWRALRGSATPYFVYPHGMLDPWFRETYPLKHLKKWCYWPWAEYRVLRDATAVLFTCDEERRLARQSFSLYRAIEAVVSYGSPGPSGDAASQTRAFLDAHPHLRGKRLLLFLGRIHPKKGLDLLIDAFATLSNRAPDLHLVIAGPDAAGWQPALEQRAREHGVTDLTWTGMLTGDLKWGAFHCAEAFVLPSHQENFGIAVAEALACGLPVLISNKVNIWREIREAGAGLIARDDAADTTALLQRWVAMDGEARARMADNARNLFRTRFHIDAAALSLVQVMAACIAGVALPATAQPAG